MAFVLIAPPTARPMKAARDVVGRSICDRDSANAMVANASAGAGGGTGASAPTIE